MISAYVYMISAYKVYIYDKCIYNWCIYIYIYIYYQCIYIISAYIYIISAYIELYSCRATDAFLLLHCVYHNSSCINIVQILYITVISTSKHVYGILLMG